MNAGGRFLLTIAIVLAALLALAMCGYQNWRVEEQDSLLDRFGLASAETKPELCMDEQTREEIRGLLLDGLRDALKAHIEHTYEVWLRDDTGQPARARNGVERGIRAYMLARKSTIDWSPPPCAG